MCAEFRGRGSFDSAVCAKPLAFAADAVPKSGSGKFEREMALAADSERMLGKPEIGHSPRPSRRGNPDQRRPVRLF